MLLLPYDYYDPRSRESLKVHSGTGQGKQQKQSLFPAPLPCFKAECHLTTFACHSYFLSLIGSQTNAL